MKHFETSATVQGTGEIHLVGLPYLAGTEVDILVTPKAPATGDDRVATLMSALDRASNDKSVGRLRREELYDRNGLR
jgi:hypothetical protein